MSDSRTPLSSYEYDTVKFRMGQGRTLASPFWHLRHRKGGGWAVFFPFTSVKEIKVANLDERPDYRAAMWVVRTAVQTYPGRFSDYQIVTLIDLLTSLVANTSARR